MYLFSNSILIHSKHSINSIFKIIHLYKEFYNFIIHNHVEKKIFKLLNYTLFAWYTRSLTTEFSLTK